MMKNLLCCTLLLTLAASACALPSFSEVKQNHRPSDTLLLDRYGEVIHRLRTDASVRRGQWLALHEISPALRQAMLLSEDKRFHQHSGVDWRAVSAAAWGNLWNSRTRGASTLTMQLAGLLDQDLAQRGGGRSVAQKLGQTVAAGVLERRWRKDEILEAWLNLVPLRGEIVGIDALARTLFGKAAHALDERESAVAAALVRAPNADARRVARRACEVLRASSAAAGCDALELFTTAALQRRAYDASEGLAPHLARRLAAESRGMRSTLDASLQRLATETLQRQLRELRGRRVHDGAIVVLDNRSGDVLAWVGSSGASLSAAAEVDGVSAPRQAGSTLKPFLYAQAIEQKRLTAASLLDDSPAHLPTASGLYIPQNYDRQFKGWVSARTALAASLNVPAVRTLAMVSPQAFARQLRALGLPLREGGDYYGLSLALGSAEVSLLSLTNAYRTLANGGLGAPARWSADAPRPAPQPRIDAGAAFIVSDILADPLARAPTFGIDSVLATRFWSAVKTGTSKDMRDNWAVGYSRHHTVGVWVGNADGSPMWDVSGTSGAAPIWAALMRHLHQRLPSQPPAAPAGLVQARAEFDGPHEAARTEWFVAGTAQRRFALADDGPAGADAARARILSPAAGTIVALDPDIPPEAQRLSLRSSQPAVRWLIDGREVGRGASALWLPWPGRHTVTLADARGRTLDERRIEVRGAGVRDIGLQKVGARGANAGGLAGGLASDAARGVAR